MQHRWFSTERVAPAVTRIHEPHVDPLLRSNAWHVRGADRDVVVDSGLGLVSLRASLPELFGNDPLLVVTHAHLDHAGGAHEFAEVAVHPAEVDLVEHPPPVSLRSRELCDQLGLTGAYRDGLPETLVTVSPHPGFDPGAYAVRPATVTRTVDEGDRVDLGDRRLTVVHLPGHSAGSIGLLDESARALFSGDALYDGALLDTLHGSDATRYRMTMRRLAEPAWDVVYPGHGEPLTADRARELAAAYLRSKQNERTIR